MSNKMWDALIEHAKTCVLSGKLYVYYPEDTRNVGVVFNNIYELSGLIAGEQFHSADALSDSQKVNINLFLLVYLFIFGIWSPIFIFWSVNLCVLLDYIFQNKFSFCCKGLYLTHNGRVETETITKEN